MEAGIIVPTSQLRRLRAWPVTPTLPLACSTCEAGPGRPRLPGAPGRPGEKGLGLGLQGVELSLPGEEAGPEGGWADLLQPFLSPCSACF